MISLTLRRRTLFSSIYGILSIGMGPKKARSEVKRHSKRPEQSHVWATAPAFLFAKLLLFPALNFDSLLVANCLTKHPICFEVTYS